MLDSRKIEHLDKRLQKPARDFIAACKAANIHVAITSTLRDAEYQNYLYAQGRTRKGRIVTSLKGGSSYHNYGLALDFVPIVKGKANYNNLSLFIKAGAIAKKLGFVWGGDFKTFIDRPHLQMTFGLTIAELKAGKR
jgi:peptidoglycan LD-endopeptidase CwlK